MAESLKVSIKEFKLICSSVEEDIYGFLNIEGSVDSKKTSGGTSVKEVTKQIKKAKKLINQYEKV